MIKVKIKSLKDGEQFKRNKRSKVIYTLQKKKGSIVYTSYKSNLTFEVSKNFDVFIWKD